MEFGNSHPSFQSCPKGHVLVSITDLPSLHPQSGGIYRTNKYRCDICKTIKDSISDPSNHCSTCKYDLCSSCFHKNLKTSLLCTAGHSLVITKNLSSVHPKTMGGYSINRYRCNQCKGNQSSETAPSYHCSQCQFDLCPNCASGRLNPNPSPNPSGRKCDYGHNLIPTTDLPSLHPGSGGIYRTNKYRCDVCKVTKDCRANPSNHCSACKYDLCPDCSRTDPNTDLECTLRHRLVITKSLSSLHPESKGGYAINRYGCNQCKGNQSSETAPSYHCSQCKFDLCPACAQTRLKPNNVSVEPVHKSSSEAKIEQNVNNQPSSNDQILCVICLNANRSCVFDPCKHLCTCEQCSSDLLKSKQTCPICRAEIKGVFKIFLA